MGEMVWWSRLHGTQAVLGSSRSDTREPTRDSQPGLAAGCDGWHGRALGAFERVGKLIEVAKVRCVERQPTEPCRE